jgi:hypothetical protein
MPEDPRVRLTYEQLRFIQLWAAEHGASGISIAQNGKGYLELVAWDKTNVDIAHRTVPPRDLSLPE